VGLAQKIVGDSLLSSQLLGNQLPRNLQSGSRLTGEGLSTPQSRIGRADWPRYSKYGAVPVKHDECRILIR
jgi:hypothetical protein